VARLGGNEEAEQEVFRTVSELNMTQTEGAALLRATGSFESFFNAANRMYNEGLNVQQIFEMLENAAVEEAAVGEAAVEEPTVEETAVEETAVEETDD
jgi:hypothetical protein